MGMEDIRCGRVVDDNGFLQISTDLRQVLCEIISEGATTIVNCSSYLNIISLMVVAALPEQSMVDDMMDVKLI